MRLRSASPDWCTRTLPNRPAARSSVGPLVRRRRGGKVLSSSLPLLLSSSLPLLLSSSLPLLLLLFSSLPLLLLLNLPLVLLLFSLRLRLRLTSSLCSPRPFHCPSLTLSPPFQGCISAATQPPRWGCSSCRMTGSQAVRNPGGSGGVGGGSCSLWWQWWCWFECFVRAGDR